MPKTLLLPVMVLLWSVPGQAGFRAAEYVYESYAAVARVNDINVVQVNPAGLATINMHNIYVVFESPFSFSSFALPLPFSDKHTAGSMIVQDGNVQNFRFGFPVVNEKHFMAGISVGIDREISGTGNILTGSTRY